MPRIAFTYGRVTCYEMGAVVAPGYPPCTEFDVYDGDELVRVCPSEGMAREVAASV